MRNIFHGPRIPILVAIAFLLPAWASVLLFDVLSTSLSMRISRTEMTINLLFYELFAEGRWAERLQWALLTFCAGTVFWMRLRLTRDMPGVGEIRVPLTLLGLGTLIMLAEDALNVRHIVARLIIASDIIPDLSDRAIRLAWELSFYALIAALVFFSTVTILRRGFGGGNIPGATRRGFFAAFGLYGLVAFGSAMRRVGDWQENLGAFLIARLELGEDPRWLKAQEILVENEWDEAWPLSYLLVDHLVEESLELIAAALLASFLLTLRRDLITRTTGAPQSSGPEVTKAAFR